MQQLTGILGAGEVATLTETITRTQTQTNKYKHLHYRSNRIWWSR